LFLHGSVDAVCRPVSAWQAHRACLGSRLAWAEGAGHDPYHPAMAAAMVGALNGYAATGSFGQ
jgi:proline iminopeptidase